MKVVSFFLSIGIFFLVFLASSVPQAHAQTLPDPDSYFGTCPALSRSWDVVADYPTGFHWIYGNPVLQYGSDKVFKVRNSFFYTQCYCPLDHPTNPPSYTNGVQTNWLRLSDYLTRGGSLQDLLDAGWLYLGNGADVGLLPEPYMAHNLTFDCHPTSIRIQN